MAMKLEAHTPGPWHATRKEPNIIVNAGGNKWIARALIGTKKSPRFMCDPEAAAANARLMAAAPDLLAALKHAVHWHDQLSKQDIARFQAVIAAATGEA